MISGMTWLRQAAEAAERACNARLDEWGAAIAEALDGVAIEREAGEIVVRGRALVRRWLAEPLLRFLRWNGR